MNFKLYTFFDAKRWSFLTSMCRNGMEHKKHNKQFKMHGTVINVYSINFTKLVILTKNTLVHVPRVVFFGTKLDFKMFS